MHTPATLHNIRKKEASEYVERGPSEEEGSGKIGDVSSELANVIRRRFGGEK
jgi:hypothetical protein